MANDRNELGRPSRKGGKRTITLPFPKIWLVYLFIWLFIFIFSYTLLGNPLNAVGWLFGVNPTMIMFGILMFTAILTGFLIALFRRGD